MRRVCREQRAAGGHRIGSGQLKQFYCRSPESQSGHVVHARAADAEQARDPGGGEN